MKEYEIVNIIYYKEYLNFIEKCKKKEYNKNLILHKHHIIPKFICNKEEYKKYVVELSVEDHAHAHYLFSKCFEENTIQYIKNIMAIKLLNNKSVKYKNEINNIYKNLMGENNPSKREYVKQKISKNLKEFYKNNKHSNKNKTYEEIYGIEGALIEKNKRKKTTRTKEEYLISAKKAAIKLKGRVPHNAIKFTLNGIEYDSYEDASKKLKISIYKIKKLINYEKNSY